MLVIKNATIINEDRQTQKDILIKDGKIEKIGEDLSKFSKNILDAKGYYLLPGIVDLNVRLKDNTLSLENIKGLEEKALRSGVTTVVLRSDFEPRIDERILLELLKGSLESSKIDISLSANALKDQDSVKLNDLSILIDSGAVAIRQRSDVDGNILRRIFQYSLMKKRPFFIECDNRDLNDNGVMHEGVISSTLGVDGRSKISEISEVAKSAYMAEYYDAKTLFCALSTSRSLYIVDKLKQNGAKLFSEVSILHLIFNDSACSNFNTLAKIEPPLRDEDERLSLVLALKEGKIDLITSLHSRQSYTRKDVAFSDASYGADVLEYFLPLCYTYLVKNGLISLSKLIELISTNPAQLIGRSSLGKIEEGACANMILFDPNYKFRVENSELLFNDKELYGRVIHTIYNGEIVN
jgi:dihydroorotase